MADQRKRGERFVSRAGDSVFQTPGSAFPSDEAIADHVMVMAGGSVFHFHRHREQFGMWTPVSQLGSTARLSDPVSSEELLDVLRGAIRPEMLKPVDE